MRRSKGCLHRAFCSRGVGHHPLRLAETQRQAEGWESFTQEKGTLQARCWPGKLEMAPSGSGRFSGWCSVGNRDKIREAVRD